MEAGSGRMLGLRSESPDEQRRDMLTMGDRRRGAKGAGGGKMNLGSLVAISSALIMRSSALSVWSTKPSPLRPAARRESSVAWVRYALDNAWFLGGLTAPRNRVMQRSASSCICGRNIIASSSVRSGAESSNAPSAMRTGSSGDGQFGLLLGS